MNRSRSFPAWKTGTSGFNTSRSATRQPELGNAKTLHTNGRQFETPATTFSKTEACRSTVLIVDPRPFDYAALERAVADSQTNGNCFPKSVPLQDLVGERIRLLQRTRLQETPPRRIRPLADLSQWEMRYVQTGRAAIRISEHVDAKLWMINARLPDMSGFDLYEMLSPGLFGVPVFLVADQYRLEDERESLRLGATKFLCKPAATSWLLALRRNGGAAPPRPAGRPPPPGKAVPLGDQPIRPLAFEDT